MPPRTRKSEPTPNDPETFDGNPEDDPALADPDAKGPSPRPEDDLESLEDDNEDIDLTARDKHDDPDREYVVLTDAIVISTGPKPEDTVRLYRGQVVKFSEKTRQHTNVAAFATVGAIADNDGEPKARATAAALAQAAGGGDPVPNAKAVYAREQATAAPVDTEKSSTEA